MSIGTSLKEIREINEKSLLQVEKDTGISNQNLGRWEKDKVLPSIEFCIILADYYQVSLDELVGRDFRENTQKTRIKYYKCKF